MQALLEYAPDHFVDGVTQVDEPRHLWEFALEDDLLQLLEDGVDALEWKKVFLNIYRTTVEQTKDMINCMNIPPLNSMACNYMIRVVRLVRLKLIQNDS